jgi:hypothetical protein
MSTKESLWGKGWVAYKVDLACVENVEALISPSGPPQPVKREHFFSCLYLNWEKYLHYDILHPWLGIR